MVLTLSPGANAQDHDHASAIEKLGTVAFATSCSAAAQPQFNRAVALLHSFEFPRAIDAFGATLTTDPSCAIAEWGIALSRWSNPFAVGVRPAGPLQQGRDAVEPWPFVHPETGKAVPPPYPMLACNPDVETHWIYTRFHPESPEHHERYAPDGYHMFHMPSFDPDDPTSTEGNRFLGETNRQFLLRQDSAFIRRNVRGLWGQPEGAIHAVHPSSVLEGTVELVDYLRRTCTLFRTMDYGDSAPTCVLWWGVDRSGNCFAWQEYYLGNATISTHRGNIASISDPHDRFERDLADPSIFHKMPAKQGGRFCIADEYAEVLQQPRHTAGKTH